MYDQVTLRDHLLSRHVDLDLHRPVIDEHSNVATFYLWNLSGQLVGYQQYRPDCDKKMQNNPRDGRYFTYRRNDTIAVWGVESLKLSSDMIFLTEGIFDAARLTEKGVSALAVLSNNPNKDLKNWLRTLNRRVIAVCDNDVAGRKLAKFGDKVEYSLDKDLGDSSDEFVNILISKYERGI